MLSSYAHFPELYKCRHMHHKSVVQVYQWVYKCRQLWFTGNWSILAYALSHYPLVRVGSSAFPCPLITDQSRWYCIPKGSFSSRDFFICSFPHYMHWICSNTHTKEGDQFIKENLVPGALTIGSLLHPFQTYPSRCEGRYKRLRQRRQLHR